jgi:hypothetical protein
MSILLQRVEVLKAEYQDQLEKVSSLKRRLNDLEMRETEDISQLELERSLLNAEFDSETQKLSKSKMKIALLKHKELRLSGIYEDLQKEFRDKMNEGQSRIATLEEGIDRLKFSENVSKAIKTEQLNEQLDIERKVIIDS